MALLRLKYGAKPRNLEFFYDRCFFSCLFAGVQSKATHEFVFFVCLLLGEHIKNQILT